MKLTKRLACVWQYVPECHCIADVGTDHGYLAAALITGGKAEKVVAIDVNEGPLASARQYVASLGLNDKIECRLGNGLQATKEGELDGAVMCGMGGFLMRDIIAGGPEFLNFYVLQPQNGQKELRHYLKEADYIFEEEVLVEDMGKVYEIWVVRRRAGQGDDPDGIDNLMAEGKAGTRLASPFVRDVYDELPTHSLLWEVGALLYAQKPDLWEKHLQKHMAKRQKALQGMGNMPNKADLYRRLKAELYMLEQLL